MTSIPDPRSREGISLRLRGLARAMGDLGYDMDYIGGFGELGKHGREMIGAAKIAFAWADGIEADLASRTVKQSLTVETNL